MSYIRSRSHLLDLGRSLLSTYVHLPLVERGLTHYACQACSTQHLKAFRSQSFIEYFRSDCKHTPVKGWQCDLVAWLFFKIWPFVIKKTCQFALKIPKLVKKYLNIAQWLKSLAKVAKLHQIRSHCWLESLIAVNEDFDSFVGKASFCRK